MPDVTTVNELVNALLDAQLATAPVTIRLLAGSYDISTSTVLRDSRFGTGALVCGFPHILKHVTIISAYSSGFTTIIRNLNSPKYRHFYVAQGGTLILRNVRLINGDVGDLDTGGGAIFNDGTVEAYDCWLGPGNKSNYGGAILNNRGTVSLYNCDIKENEADWGGGLYNYVNNCTMNITDSRISNNNGGTGGGLTNFGVMNIEHCAIVGNTAANGAGIASWDANARLTVLNSIISQNSALTNGGGILEHAGQVHVECSTMMNNAAAQGPLAYRNSANFGFVEIFKTALPKILTGLTVGNVVIESQLPPRYPNFVMVVNASKKLVPRYQNNRLDSTSWAISLSRDNFDTFPLPLAV